MSQENVEAFKRALEAANRRDVEAFLEELDPEVEWHPVMPAALAGKAAVYRGHEGVHELFGDRDEAFAESDMEFSEIRDLGDRIVAIGRLRSRGKASGAEIDSPLAFVADFKNSKATRVQSYLDPKEAFEAAGLRE